MNIQVGESPENHPLESDYYLQYNSSTILYHDVQTKLPVPLDKIDCRAVARNRRLCVVVAFPKTGDPVTRSALIRIGLKLDSTTRAVYRHYCDFV